MGSDAAAALEEAKAEDAAGLEKVLATSQGLSGDDAEKRVAAEDEPKPAELVSVGLEVTPPEGVPAAVHVITQAFNYEYFGLAFVVMNLIFFG